MEGIPGSFFFDVDQNGWKDSRCADPINGGREEEDRRNTVLNDTQPYYQRKNS